MISYTIKVNNLKTANVDSMTGVVKHVNFTVTGVDGDQTFSLPSSLTLGDPDPQNFIPLQTLTEADVVEWLESKPELDSIKAHVALVVQKMIDEAALTEQPLPWEPAPTPTPTPAPV